MKAAVVGETALEIRDVPQPQAEAERGAHQSPRHRPQPRRAAGRLRLGPYRVTGTIPGIECSGEVVEIGAEVQGVKLGDRVMCSGQRRLCRIRGRRLGPRLADSRQQYELGAGRDLADRARHHA